MQKGGLKSDKVSVVIPAYNTAKFIKNTLNSVISQTYSNLEIIVIDDASTDDTLNVIKSFKDKRIVLLKNKVNLGVSDTRNRGIRKATGRFLCFLDSDDIWDKMKVERQVASMKESKADISCTDYYFCSSKGEVKSYVKVPSLISYEYALKNTTIFISTVMIDLDKVDREDVHMLPYTIAQDTLLFWGLLKKYDVIHGFNGIPSKYIRRKGSLSANKIKAVIGSFRAYLLQDLPFRKKLKYFLYYLINAVRRRV